MPLSGERRGIVKRPKQRVGIGGRAASSLRANSVARKQRSRKGGSQIVDAGTFADRGRPSVGLRQTTSPLVTLIRRIAPGFADRAGPPGTCLELPKSRCILAIGSRGQERRPGF